jgi:hypothetical protein
VIFDENGKIHIKRSRRSQTREDRESRGSREGETNSQGLEE